MAYRTALLTELARDWWNDHADNYDHDNDAAEPPARKWREIVERYRSESPRGQFLYDLLGDKPSRRLLIKLIAYRIQGHRKVKLPRNTPQYWQDIKSMLDLRTNTPLLPVKFIGGFAELAAYDLRPLGYSIACHASGAGLACALVQKQYEYHHGAVHCKAEAGDVVIDAGGCWGETSLYFAHEAGPTGALVAFEFIPGNLAVMKHNLAFNPHLAGNFHIVEHPLWSSEGVNLHYVDWGPASWVSMDLSQRGSWDGASATVTIDDSLRRLGLQRVDFIKMDIEGAELAALKGAEKCLRRDRPKLAISVYHKADDIDVIPRYLAGLELGYRFYLDHHTIYKNETVLFGVPPQASSSGMEHASASQDAACRS
jgi:FkbM family methyltransferase